MKFKNKTFLTFFCFLPTLVVSESSFDLDKGLVSEVINRGGCE